MYRKGGLNLDFDLIFRVVILIIAIGICVKSIKFVTSLIFKLALIAFIVLLAYKIFLI